MSNFDLNYMKRAIEIAKKGVGFVNPNPLVGAVIVKDGKIIGEGYHQKYGELHAERNAIANCCESPQNAHIYVTLEPCCHYGKTPPCTEAIIEAGISKVIIGSTDKNPIVHCNGIQFLKDKGVEVVTGVLEEECDELNEIFFHYILKKRPFVIMKYAMTVDGKIATTTGRSKWITSEKSRENVHFTRNRVSAIMVGIGTVLADDPMLNCRCENASELIRVVCDSNLKIPFESNIVKTANKIKTYVAYTEDIENKSEELQRYGINLILTPKKNNKVDLNYLMDYLGGENIDSILLEGGSELNFSALENDIVDKLQVYIAPKIFGGKDAKSAVAGIGVNNPNEAFLFSSPKIQMFDEDILIEYKKVR